MAESPDAKRTKLSHGDLERASIEAEDAAQSCSPLEQLPRELIWKIIEYAPQTVNNMRLSCACLRNRVSEYAREPMIMPLIEKLIIFVPVSIPMHVPYRKKAKVTIKTSVNKMALLQWRLNALKRRLEKEPKMLRVTKTREGETWRYFYFDLFVKWDRLLWLDIVREWIGRRIKEVEVCKLINYEELAVVGNLLKDIAIDNLSFFAETLGDDNFNFLRKCCADHLSLNVCKVGTSSGPVDVLRELSSIYRSMHIFQRWTSEDVVQIFANRTTKYFFGLYNHNWATVFAEMFSRKLNMLRIENYEYPQYCSSTEEDRLVERLTAIGKPVWFQTNTASRDRHFDNEINDHWVKSRENLLTITHRTHKHGPTYFHPR